MKILMTGATGLIGKHIGMELVRRGHEIHILARDPKSALLQLPFPCKTFPWRSHEDVPVHAMEGIEAIIHLAGEPVAGGRWTDSRKKQIYDSRVIGTRKITQAILTSGNMVHTFISTSAIGYYGDRGDEALTESAGSGQGFLPEVCTGWEKATEGLPASVRKAIIRIGIVLSLEGGALKELLSLYKKGMGGVVGDGQQWMSWIHIRDLARVFVNAVEDSAYQGVINGVSPHPIRNETFNRIFSKHLDIPAFFRVPKFAVKLALGEQAVIALDSQNVVPKKLESLSFDYKHPLLDHALQSILDEAKDPKTGKIIDTITAYQWVPASLDQLFPFFSEARNLEKLTPPWLGFKITSETAGPMAQGKNIEYQIKLHGIPMNWKTEITHWEPGKRFVDDQLKGPYATWNHCHEFEALAGGTLMTDHVRFRLPAGYIGSVAAGWKVRAQVEEIFNFRREAVAQMYPIRAKG